MTNDIHILLSESTNPCAFTNSNRIHKNEFNRVIKMINERLQIAKEEKEREKDKNNENRTLIRRHNTISILGSRGSGKTSFLYSIIEYCNNKYDKIDEKDRIKDVSVLDIIDPTLIEEKGHVLLTIISLINEKLDEVLSKECNTENDSYRHRKKRDDKLRKLSRGLPSIDGIGVNADDKWQDPDYIMDKGIKSVHAAKELEKNFHEFLCFALEVLKKDCFILALDDIDVDFLRGWPVIETVRKYLTSPLIITLISGDLRLYSKAIRKQQWKNFGKALLKNEGEYLDKMHYYNELVTEMEGQYMAKVIRSECRVKLTTLGEKIASKENIVIEYVKDKDNDKPIEIKNAYDKIMRLFGINNKYQAETYISFLLNLPIRTQIRFLNSFAYSNDKIESSPESFSTEAFMSELYEKEVDIEMAMNTPKMMNAIIMKLLLEDEMLADAYQLQPTMTDHTLNSALISLSMLFAKKTIDNPHLIFDYFVKVGYPRNLTAVLPYADKNERNSEIKPSIEGLCNYSYVFQDRVLRDVAGCMVSYVRGYYNSISKSNVDLYCGTIPIYASGAETSINKVFSKTSSLQRHVANIPATKTLFAHKQSSITVYSIYTLFGAIGELLRKAEIEEDLSKGILELSQVRYFRAPNFTDRVDKEKRKEIRNETEIEFDIDLTPDKTDETDDTMGTLATMIKEWVGRYPGKVVPPHLLGKIITRCYYSIQSIENHKFGSLGEYMHRTIIAFMNAVLIEDIKENKDNVGKLNIDNAVTSNNRFISNLRVAKSLGYDKLHFSQWLLSCPLFMLYLNPSDELNDYVTLIENAYTGDNAGNMKSDEILRHSIYEKLCEVNIPKYPTSGKSESGNNNKSKSPTQKK